MNLPRILVIDDLFGRTVEGSGNEDRANLCRSLRLVDNTGDQPSSMQAPQFLQPLAEATFHRGQKPFAAVSGDSVENDLPSILERVGKGPEVPLGRLPWALILLDLCFHTGKVTERSEERRGPGMPVGRASDVERYFGLDILAALSTRLPGIPVLLLSSMPRAEVAREYATGGAVGFLEKDLPKAEAVLEDYLFHHGLLPDPRDQIAGSSRALLKALRAGRRGSASDRPVLIRGERGTGKELVARYLWEQLRREPPTQSDPAPFVAVNCGRFSEPNLAFSTIFGHRKGSYTGADRDRAGLVLQARGGVLFFDEIGLLPLEVQGGLHRLLQEGEVAPLGAEETPQRGVRVKLLAATNADLEGMALEQPPRFMPDLLDRLKLGDTVTLPPLRDRLEDIPLLVERFVRKAEEEAGPGAYRGRVVDPEVYRVLEEFDWPGNVRQLEECVGKAVRTYKHMELLVPQCLELPRDVVGHVHPGVRPAAAARPPGPAETSLDSAAGDLRTALVALRFEADRPQELYGLLDGVLRVLGAYVEAVLRATARPSTSEPAGLDLLVQAAGRWMSGDDEQSATFAADSIKRLLKPLERAGLLTPLLQQALARAREVRPKRRGRSRGDGKSAVSAEPLAPDSPSQ